MKRAEIVDSAAAVTASLPAIAVPPRRWIRLLVLLSAAVLFFARLGTRALWASEFRWAEIAREMILNHNYFWPTINGHVYYDKPLGSYWLVVASTYLTGAMNEAAARLPSAIAGLLAVALLISLAQRLYNARVALMAGVILATSFSFVFWSRHADADVETITGELAVLLIFWTYQERSGPWVIAMWLLMALTSLTKGLLGFVLPLIVIGVFANLRDGWAPLAHRIRNGSVSERLRSFLDQNRWFFNWYTPIAIAVAGAIYYWPFAISHAETGSGRGLYMVYRENVERYFAPFDHVGPIYPYVYVIFALMAPWSAFLPAALLRTHRTIETNDEEARSDRFVLSFFWAIFIFFTVSGSRRSYYLLPLLPAAAIIVARLFERGPEAAGRSVLMLFRIGFGFLCVAVVASMLALIPSRLILPPPYSTLPNLPAPAMFVIFVAGSILALGFALRGFTPTRAFGAIAIATWLFMFYFFVFAMPAGDQWRSEKTFARQVRATIDGDTAALALYRNGGPVYYLDLPAPIPSYSSRPELLAAVASGRTRWIIVRRRDIDQLGIPASESASEAVFPWDTSQHRLDSMVLMRLTAAPPPSR